jgi:hypothetical protein
MGVFKNSQQFYDTVGEVMVCAALDPDIGSSVARTECIIQFRYTDPEVQITLNAKDRPTQPDAYFDVFFGPSDLRPDVVMTMQADLAHEFWQGRLNLFSALARGQVVATGLVTPVLRLVPVVEPMYLWYLALLREQGLADLISK